MTDISLHAAARLSLPFRIFSGVVQFIRTASSAYDRYLQRQRLADLDGRMLADLGLSRNDVDAECRKSWWPV